MTKDRIEFAIGDDYGELTSNINDWLSKAQNITVKKIDLFFQGAEVARISRCA